MGVFAKTYGYAKGSLFSVTLFVSIWLCIYFGIDRHFGIGVRTDVENDYVGNAISIIEANTPTRYRHPGTGLQYLLSGLMRGENFYDLDRLQTILERSYICALFLTILAIIIFHLKFGPLLKSNYLGYGLIPVAFLLPSIVYYMQLYSSEMLTLAWVLFIMALSVPSLKRPFSVWSSIAWGFALGIGVTIKFSFIPLVIGAFFGFIYSKLMALKNNERILLRSQNRAEVTIAALEAIILSWFAWYIQPILPLHLSIFIMFTVLFVPVNMCLPRISRKIFGESDNYNNAVLKIAVFEFFTLSWLAWYIQKFLPLHLSIFVIAALLFIPASLYVRQSPKSIFTDLILSSFALLYSTILGYIIVVRVHFFTTLNTLHREVHEVLPQTIADKIFSFIKGLSIYFTCAPSFVILAAFLIVIAGIILIKLVISNKHTTGDLGQRSSAVLAFLTVSLIMVLFGGISHPFGHGLISSIGVSTRTAIVAAPLASAIYMIIPTFINGAVFAKLYKLLSAVLIVCGIYSAFTAFRELKIHAGFDQGSEKFIEDTITKFETSAGRKPNILFWDAPYGPSNLSYAIRQYAGQAGSEKYKNIYPNVFDENCSWPYFIEYTDFAKYDYFITVYDKGNVLADGVINDFLGNGVLADPDIGLIVMSLREPCQDSVPGIGKEERLGDCLRADSTHRKKFR